MNLNCNSTLVLIVKKFWYRYGGNVGIKVSFAHNRIWIASIFGDVKKKFVEIYICIVVINLSNCFRA